MPPNIRAPGVIARSGVDNDEDPEVDLREASALCLVRLLNALRHQFMETLRMAYFGVV